MVSVTSAVRVHQRPTQESAILLSFLLPCGLSYSYHLKLWELVVNKAILHRDPMDFSLSGSCAHGIFQAGVLEWGAIAFSVW